MELSFYYKWKRSHSLHKTPIYGEMSLYKQRIGTENGSPSGRPSLLWVRDEGRLNWVLGYFQKRNPISVTGLKARKERPCWQAEVESSRQKKTIKPICSPSTQEA